MARVRTTLWLPVWLSVMVACAPAATTAPSSPPVSGLAASLDAVLAESFPSDQPGAAAIVVRDGVVLLRGGHGMADLEQGVPLSPEHVFRIGSITKQFTAVAILMLAEEGKLSLDDPLTRFFPDYPTGGRTVTVEHLLAHTSGIRSYTSMPEWGPTVRQDLSLDELIAVFRDQPFDFEPGELWSYNNSGYVLLGAIIERLSGMSYAEFVESRIFRPLSMTASHYGDASRIIPGRVPGYSRPGGGEWVNSEYVSMTHPHAAGALLSSVDDLARWDRAISRGELLSPASWRRAFTPIRLDDGRGTGYGAGWSIGRVGPYGTVEHGGGINGFSAYALRVPEARLFVAVLANADNPLAGPGQVALRLADLALEGALDEPAVAVAPERLADYVGVYRIDPAAARTITLEDGVLYSQRTGGNRFELRPIGPDLFLFPTSGTRLRFAREAGRVTAMVMEPRTGMDERAERLPGDATQPRQAITLPSESYAAFPGTYRLAPNFEIRITREGDQLYGQATGQGRVTLMPESPTRFFLVEVPAVVDFIFEDGRVTGLTLHQGGRSIPGPRVD
jgi:D-alanyl-D-alanine carboxypeptidase